jgi:hypothetical protein
VITPLSAPFVLCADASMAVAIITITTDHINLRQRFW